MGFKIKKTVNGETVWEPIKAKKYTSSKTIEYTGTLPITINTNEQPLLDYQISGNTVQTGTPTPENPIMPEGVGERTENLFDKGSVTQNYFMSQNGKVSSLTGAYSDYIPVRSNAQYYITQGVKLTSFYTTCTYDSTKRFISYCNINGVSGVITTPNNCAYVIINVYKSNFNIAMFTAGSTAPASYIPYGYKLPMVSRGENLWNSELEQGTFDISTGEERDASERIRSDYIHIQNSDNYTITLTGAEGVVVYVYDANKSFLSAESTVEWQALPFTREIEANRYVRFAFAKSASGDYSKKITPSDVSNIMLVKGDTASDSYIPYYREETPIYIGDTKLAKDEYVSYSEQKVYKYNGELTLKGDETNIYYYGIFEGVQTFYIDISNNSEIVSGLQPYLSCNYYTKTSIIYPGVNKTCRYQSPNVNSWDIGRVYFMDNDYTSLSSFKTHLSELYDAGKPLKVVYTLKNAPISIDPPVPLPALPTIRGETIIDYDGAPKPSQMYVKYNSWSGWSDIDNYKMDNGDWTQEAT